MSSTPIKRQLWYFDRIERIIVDQDFLTTDPRSLVVLGEAGIGKSTLLEQLEAKEGYVVCTARKLLNHANPASLLGNASTLVIDALDEVSVQGEGEAVDRVVRNLAALGCPRFILSCRVADWRSATALQGISDYYDDCVLELHLDPLERDDAISFLTTSLGPDKATQTIDHLEDLGLGGLWGNPQTLELIERVASAGTLPKSKGELFEQATKLLRAEHREEKASSILATLPELEVLNAAGAGFASLILTGKEALSRLVQVEPGDAPVREVAPLPAAARLPDILDSRLFKARASERFSYTHRAIGEYLGARWLARMTDTPRKRRRLLALFNSQAVVPVSIRGIHAWLAWHSPEMAEQVIAADPMGVIEYGDADKLSPDQAKALFTALSALSRENPEFRGWVEYRASGLIQPSLFPEIRLILTDKTREFGLRKLILQAMKGAEQMRKFVIELRSLMFDDAEAYALRSEAASRLLELDPDEDWSAHFTTLLDGHPESSARLAIEMMGKIRFGRFSDRLVLDVIAAQLNRSESMIGGFYRLEHDFPADRLDALLDGIAAMAPNETNEDTDDDVLFDLACSLLSRRLAGVPPDAERLWSWLKPFDNYARPVRGNRKALATALAANDHLRRGVQRLVLLDSRSDQTIWAKAWRLADRSVGLGLNEADVGALLDNLADGDLRWRDIVLLARHDATSGSPVRGAAMRFAIAEKDKAWLVGLENPPIPEWQVEQEQRQQKRAAQQTADWERHRADFKSRIEALRAGDYGWVLSPAKAYLKLFSDMGDEVPDGPSRIEKWLGAEIKDAALEGFEAFLNKQPPQPSASDMAVSFAESRRWEAGSIIVAALAERSRTSRGFDDLPDERLMAGLFDLRHTKIADHADLKGLESALAGALRKRGKWDAAQRLFFEPQFAARLQYVDGLQEFFTDTDHLQLADTLAAEWLQRFPEMSGQAEAHLVDHLMSNEIGRAALLELLPTRVSMSVSDERRRNWDAIGLLISFPESRTRLDTKTLIEPELLWHLRGRFGGRRNSPARPQLEVAQLEWAIKTFRANHEFSARPTGITSGDTNPWNATEFLIGLINQLGDSATEAATNALVALRNAPQDGYTEALRIAVAEQKRKRVEAEWSAPDLQTVAAAITDTAPTNAMQMQAVIIEELAEVQKKIRGSDVDWYKNFFNGEKPQHEEVCRDTILKMFGSLPFGIHAAPEGHVADDKRCDIICTLGKLMVPIEVKGQWHKDLWTAADQQLDRLYTNDWRAGHGIYVVLWFGPTPSNRLHKPPKGIELPATADALRKALVDQSATTRSRRTEIVILDITRPT